MIRKTPSKQVAKSRNQATDRAMDRPNRLNRAVNHPNRVAGFDDVGIDDGGSIISLSIFLLY